MFAFESVLQAGKRAAAAGGERGHGHFGHTIALLGNFHERPGGVRCSLFERGGFVTFETFLLDDYLQY